jgi:thiol-disulfide isomerase/thioredoxin
MAWRRLLITVLLIAPVLWLLAFGFTRDARYITSPLLAKEAAPFTVTLFDGRKISLTDLRGKAVFLNFWASWCTPCRTEAKDLEAAWQRLRDKNMVFLGVALQDTEKNSRAFLRNSISAIPMARMKAEKSPSTTACGEFPRVFSSIPKDALPISMSAASAPRWSTPNWKKPPAASSAPRKARTIINPFADLPCSFDRSSSLFPFWS